MGPGGFVNNGIISAKGGDGGDGFDENDCGGGGGGGGYVRISGPFPVDTGKVNVSGGRRGAFAENGKYAENGQKGEVEMIVNSELGREGNCLENETEVGVEPCGEGSGTTCCCSGSSNSPPTALMECDDTLCPGGSCNAEWIMYQPTADPPSCVCLYKIKNTSTDPDGQEDIVKSKWYLDDQFITECEGLCDWTIQPGIDPGNHTIKLYVEDSAGNSDETSHSLYIKREIKADFMCSKDGVNWQYCEELRATEGEIIYVKDDPSLERHSVLSEGANFFTKRIWQKGDGENFETFAQNINFASTTASMKKNILRLYVEDNNGRCDQQDYPTIVTYPFPQWKEIPPFIIFFEDFLAKAKKFFF